MRPLARRFRRFARPTVEALEDRRLLASPLPQATADVNFRMGRMVADPVRDLVYVADQTDAQIIAVDTDLGRGVGSRALAVAPGALAVSPSGDRLFVAEPGAQIQILSLPGLTPLKTLRVSIGVGQLVAIANDRLVVSTAAMDFLSSLAVVDAETGQVLSAINGPLYGAPLFGTNATGTRLYVRTSGGSGPGGAVDEYDVSGRGPVALTNRYPAPRDNPTDFVVNESARRIYTADGGVYGVGVTNMDTRSETAWPDFDSGAAAVAALPSGPVYIATGTGTIIQFDTSGTVQAQYPTTPLGVDYESMKITPNGHLLYGTVTGDHTSELGILGASSLAIPHLTTTYVVTTTKDILGDTTPGELTLRDAITALDGTPSGNATAVGTGSNVITFAIPASGPQTIDVGSDPSALNQPLPAITNQVFLDGWSQGGAGYAGPPLIALNGARAGPGANGLELDAGSDGSTVRGLVIQQFGGNGLELSGTSADLLTGNYVGTDAGGGAALGNGHTGVFLSDAAANTVGGTAAADANVISGNDQSEDTVGLEIGGSRAIGNLVVGNRVGTDASGTAAVPNASDGIAITSGATANTVGGTAAAAANLISGNRGPGVELSGDATSGNVVLGNRIGTDATGTAKLGNDEGVLLRFNATANTVGGAAAGSANVISGNGRFGVDFSFGPVGNVVAGNLIGTDITGTAALGNFSGLTIDSGTANTVGGTAAGAGNVISGNDTSGLAIRGSGTSGNVVLGNRIGTDITGTAALGNQGDGLSLVSESSANTIGGAAPGAGNVISGNNGDGVDITGFASGYTVLGNLIGTDVTGTAPLGNNGHGILIGNGQNTIGGTAAGAGNVISANASNGVELSAEGASGNVLLGNLIGIDRSGTAALGNATDGVVLNNAANANTVGGTAAGAANVISGNGGNGVAIRNDDFSSFGVPTHANVIAGNLIGTDRSGSAALGNGNGGVFLGDTGTAGNTVGGTAAAANVVSANFAGVEIGGRVRDNVVVGNRIGTDATGTAALGNTFGLLLDGSGDLIDQTTAPARNTIQGNLVALGLSASATRNAVVRLRLGTNAAGTAALPLPNDFGLAIAGAGNTVGGAAYAGAANVLSGNADSGVVLFGAGATGNVIRFNFIGTRDGGAAPLGNDFAGVLLEQGAAGNVIGPGNVISANGGVGVALTDAGTSGNAVVGNLIGTDVRGTGRLGNHNVGVLLESSASQNTIGGAGAGAGNAIAFSTEGVDLIDSGTVGDSILGNRIWGNAQLGIDLGNDGPTPNGANPRAFPNDGQNTPVITGLTLHSVSGTLASVPGTRFRLEFFASPPGGAASQGQIFLGALTVTTDAAGHVWFTAPVAAIPPGTVVTATATNLATGDTSEFSPVGTQLLVLSYPVIPFSAAPQVVTLTAQLFSASGPVAGAQVTFTIAGLPGKVTGTVGRNGMVTVRFAVPGGQAPGHYAITARFAGMADIVGALSDALLTIVQPVAQLGRRYGR